MNSASSGGPVPARRAPRVRTAVTDAPIDSREILQDIGGTGDGAVVLFEGRVRDTNDGRPVTGLRYEAYREMAERELAAIAAETAGRYDLGEIVVVHRTGHLEPGDVSVSIAVSAPHRDAGYQASRSVIEDIKRRLPVWKHEQYADGTAAWVAAPVPQADRGRQGSG